MFQALLNAVNISIPRGICSFDSRFCYGTSHDTKATNKANKEMNSENNQTQIDLWNQQKEYDYKMWQENNAYKAKSCSGLKICNFMVQRYKEMCKKRQKNRIFT